MLQCRNVALYLSCNLSSIIGGNLSTTNVYAKQKGASDEDLVLLNQAKETFIGLTKSIFDYDIASIPGSGGAGGLAGCLHLFCNGKLTYSFEHIFDLIDLIKYVKWADLVISGEGILDLNSIKGKAPISVALYSKRFDKKVAIICGAVSQNCGNILIGVSP